MTVKFKVEVDCANCAKKLERAIARIKDIDDANLAYMMGKMTVESNLPKEEVAELVIKEAKRVMPDAKVELI
ncbi:MAG: cation transporter [Clostridia bacterium]|nr:cation transporter [Clostridia bacterium]